MGHKWKKVTGWWFQIFLIFTAIWGRFPFWLIFFKGFETTRLYKRFLLEIPFVQVDEDFFSNPWNYFAFNTVPENNLKASSPFTMARKKSPPQDFEILVLLYLQNYFASKCKNSCVLWRKKLLLTKHCNVYMDVSENSGTPKSSILTGFSIINHPFWGTPIFGNIHMITIEAFSHIHTESCVWPLGGHPTGILTLKMPPSIFLGFT